MPEPMKLDASVLVVGAGPSGLMTSLRLASLGISVEIIDKNLYRSLYSRAIAVQIRSLEIFDSLDLLSDLQKTGILVEKVELSFENAKPLAINPSLPGVFLDQPMMVDQSCTENVLASALLKHKVKVQRGLALIEFLEEQNFVSAKLLDRDGKILEKKYAYIVGADGAHSLVRKKLGLDFLGHTYDDAFILADVILDSDLKQDLIRLYFNKGHFFAMMPLFGHNHFRLISVRAKQNQEQVPSLEEFQGLLTNTVPLPLKIIECSWLAQFKVQCRSVSSYGSERIFLVGDAAHIHSPAGGQGMNTGLQDAFNLSFKLAMALKAQGNSEILKSYNCERQPVGEFLLRYTDRLFRLMVQGSWWVRLARRWFLPWLLSSKTLSQNFWRIGSQTAIRYEKGFLCPHDHELNFYWLKLGQRIVNAELINSHVQKTSIHKIVVNNFLNLLIFFPENFDKKTALNHLEKIKNLNFNIAKNINLVPIFADDYGFSKLIWEGDLYLLSSDSFFTEIKKPSFILVRMDHHVACFGELEELSHLSFLKSFQGDFSERAD